MTTSPLEEVNNGTLSPADQKIWTALSNRNLAGHCFTPNEVSVLFEQGHYQLSVQGEPLEIGALMVRLTRGAPERSYEVAATFSSLGGVVSDPVQNLVYPSGKLLPYLQRVSTINFVPTLFFNKLYPPIAQIERQLTYPFILKPQAGFQGKGVVLVHNQNELMSYLQTSPDENLMAQEYIADIDDEFRVLVVGKKGLGVVRKIGSELTKNVEQGAYFEAVADQEVLQFAEQASQYGMADVYGTDIVRTKSGKLYLIENNRAPNFMAFESATGITVADTMVDFVAAKLKLTT